jgi:hypothetical protein
VRKLAKAAARQFIEAVDDTIAPIHGHRHPDVWLRRAEP